MQESIPPKFWGQPTWNVKHGLARFCNDPQTFVTFEINLSKLLPCDECREHYQAMLQSFGQTCLSQNPFQLSYTQHALVNHRLGKISPDFNDALVTYGNKNISNDVTSMLLYIAKSIEKNKDKPVSNDWTLRQNFIELLRSMLPLMRLNKSTVQIGRRIEENLKTLSTAPSVYNWSLKIFQGGGSNASSLQYINRALSSSQHCPTC